MEGDGDANYYEYSPEISIHALRVEGDLISFADRLGKIDISIHALRVEGDIRYAGIDYGVRISIHALRVEGDDRSANRVRGSFRYFYPRPPGGGRLMQKLCDKMGMEFLSTPSGWRATVRGQAGYCKGLISIHALRVEGDCLLFRND